MIYLLYRANKHIRGFTVIGYFKEYPELETIKEIIDPENEELKENVDYRVEECYQLV